MLTLPADLTTLRKLDNGRPLLTKREIEVFHRLAMGETCNDIAHSLLVERKTVEGFTENLREKFNISSLHRLTWLATRWSCGMIVEVKTRDPCVVSELSVKSTS